MTSPFEATDPLKKHAGDMDLSFDSLHHTIGHGPTQAAPGNHKHKIEEIQGFEETTVLTDHQLLSNRSTDDAHTQYLLKKGDVATGSLYIHAALLSGYWVIDPGVTLYRGAVLRDNSDYGAPGGAGLTIVDGNGAPTRLSVLSPAYPLQAANKQYVDASLPLTGTVTVPVVAAGGSSSTFNISFPGGRFSVLPNIQITTGSTRLNGAVVSLTTSGMSIVFSNWSPAATSGNATAWWVAIPALASARLLPTEDEDVKE